MVAQYPAVVCADPRGVRLCIVQAGMEEIDMAAVVDLQAVPCGMMDIQPLHQDVMTVLNVKLMVVTASEFQVFDNHIVRIFKQNNPSMTAPGSPRTQTGADTVPSTSEFS